MIRNVLEYLENSADRTPDRIAVADATDRCTYSELRRDAMRIGSALTRLFAPGQPVPVFAEKSVLTLKMFFGAVYAGCFYVLINPDFPPARVSSVLQTLGSRQVLSAAPYRSLFPDLPDVSVLDAADMLETGMDAEKLRRIRRDMIDTDPLYANFTSGSTGMPKGVLVCHRSVIDFIEQFTPLFGIGEKDVIGNQAPFDFDVSVKDIYSAMKTGARLEIIPKALFSAPAQLVDHLCERGITTLIWAVSALCLVSAFHGLEYRVPGRVNKVLFSGEAMPSKHLGQWMDALPDALFCNLYGPTEITCNCTYHLVERGRAYPEGLPIGVPFPNERVFLLGEDGKVITTPGQIGEICVSGTALALGYYNNPEGTAERFVPHPANTAYPEPIYRTGDLGYRSEAGEFYFCGRRDFQIKHMGHRIELEEIERALSQVPEVERACCLYDHRRSRLIACYTGAAEAAGIRRILAQHLPVFMLPGVYRQLETMPLTANGKMDRKGLASLYAG